MAWIILITAGLFEVLGVLALKRVTQTRNRTSYLLLMLALGASFSLLSFAMQHISMGTAYAIWTGIGTAGSTLLGMFVFGESKEWKRVIFIGLILLSVIGLKVIA
ncbi:QacE family quaternary ammonium compound efflux SMR transporter [Paenibacillaceae bacterium]|nr:QacE family quaternary ammonium compound efflux SMR transporter [Paenibacillaceae bacterium]